MLSKSSNSLLKLPFKGIEEFRCPMGAFHLVKDADYNLPFFDTVFYELNCVKENDSSKRNALLVNKIINCPNFSKKSTCWKFFEEQHNEAVLNKNTEDLLDSKQDIMNFAYTNGDYTKEQRNEIRRVSLILKDAKFIKNYLSYLRKQNSKNS